MTRDGYAEIAPWASRPLYVAGVIPHIIVVMGVAGAGKTSVGRALAAALGWSFYDADDYHSPANIEKMRGGHPLTDDDRRPWLATVCQLIAGVIHRDEHAVLACSALKHWYREALVPRDAAPADVRFVYLDVPRAELLRRLEARHHYFRPELLGSQFETLDAHSDALTIDGSPPVDAIVQDIVDRLALR